eukprot:scaffold18642_cov34-Cyclotella_meneghiniana.AAC.1
MEIESLSDALACFLGSSSRLNDTTTVANLWREIVDCLLHFDKTFALPVDVSTRRLPYLLMFPCFAVTVLVFSVSLLRNAHYPPWALLSRQPDSVLCAPTARLKQPPGGFYQEVMISGVSQT